MIIQDSRFHIGFLRHSTIGPASIKVPISNTPNLYININQKIIILQDRSLSVLRAIGMTFSAKKTRYLIGSINGNFLLIYNNR